MQGLLFSRGAQGIHPAYPGALVKLLENSHPMDLLCIRKCEWRQNRRVSTCNCTSPLIYPGAGELTVPCLG